MIAVQGKFLFVAVAMITIAFVLNILLWQDLLAMSAAKAVRVQSELTDA